MIPVLAALIFPYKLSANQSISYIKSKQAKLYKQKNTSSDIVDTLYQQDKVILKEQEGSWVNVDYKGKTGWVSKWLISNTMPSSRVQLLATQKSISNNQRVRASLYSGTAATRGLRNIQGELKETDSLNLVALGHK